MTLTPRLMAMLLNIKATLKNLSVDSIEIAADRRETGLPTASPAPALDGPGLYSALSRLTLPGWPWISLTKKTPQLGRQNRHCGGQGGNSSVRDALNHRGGQAQGLAVEALGRLDPQAADRPVLAFLLLWPA